jgi:hypothetical protein
MIIFTFVKKIIMKKEDIIIQGEKEQLSIKSDDALAMKLAMLFEATFSSSTKAEIADKYGYSREHYYVIKTKFQEEGSSGLIDKKPGPQNNSKRTKVVNNQIIRLKFLDPDSSSEVIGQKLRQMGYTISNRSVARTINELGLQKKNSTS